MVLNFLSSVSELTCFPVGYSHNINSTGTGDSPGTVVPASLQIRPIAEVIGCGETELSIRCQYKNIFVVGNDDRL